MGCPNTAPMKEVIAVKHWSKQIVLGAVLLLLSVLFYFFHYAIFRDAHHIFIYLIGDVAFVFIEVLMVTLIIHQVLEERDKKARIEKLNMVIGAFFSEVGTQLLAIFSRLDPATEKWQQDLFGNTPSPGDDFAKIARVLRKHPYTITSDKVDWGVLRDFLVNKRGFMLRLLENPNLLEHESFTDVLWAVFHLTEELGVRESFEGLPGADYEHLAGDMKRVYGQLARQWAAYMEHLSDSYPYLFSLALRTNPFNASASPVVGGAR